MANAEQWLLPDGVEEIFPHQAAKIEQLRRVLLDLYASWGYELVFPPLIEFMQSLQTGVGSDLKLQMFSITDHLTGRQMGLRADMTPQVARIDAHGLKRSSPVRLCYAGTVLHAKPATLGASRSLIQIGAELYGHAGVESDTEVIGLMLDTLKHSGLENVHLDLGHVGIYRGLVELAGLDEDQDKALFEIYQRKATAELEEFLERHVREQGLRAKLLELERLCGGTEVLTRAKTLFSDIRGQVAYALTDLEEVVDSIRSSYPELEIYIDCSELGGYRYHTGTVFAAYAAGLGRAVAKGGRYDHIGEQFGRNRPATGFSADLKDLVLLGERELEAAKKVFVLPSRNADLKEETERLRQQGYIVIVGLPGQQGGAKDLGCSYELEYSDGGWNLKEIGD